MEPTRDDFDRLTSALNGWGGSLARAQRSVNSDRDDASKTLKKQMGEYASNLSKVNSSMRTSIFKVENAFEQLGGSLNHTATQIRNYTQNIFGGAALGFIIERGSKMAKTFSEMNEAGYNFSGSMMKMYQAAADAGLPLSDFAELLKKNGAAFQKMKPEEFTKLALNIRNFTQSSGLYGYTVDQMNQQLADYMQTSGLYGRQNIMATQGTTRSLAGLMANTSAMSEITKKTREEIAKLANEAARGSLVIGKMNTLPEAVRSSVQMSLMKVTTVFAAQQGDAGALISKFAADSFGSGSAALTDFGKQLANVGMGDLVTDMDTLAEKVRNNTATEADAIDYNNKFKASVEANSEALNQASLGGNAEATAMIERAGQMKTISMAEYTQAQKSVKERAKVTAALQAMDSVFGKVIGIISNGFISGLSDVIGNMGELFNDHTFDMFEEAAKQFGMWFGHFVKSVLTPENLNKMTQFIINFAKAAKVIGEGVVGIVDGLIKLTPAIGWVINAALNLSEGFGKILGFFGGIIDTMVGSSNRFKDVLTATGIALGLYLSTKMLKGIGGLFTGFFMKGMKTMNVTAAIVNINGRGIPGGGGGSGAAGGAAGAAENAAGAERRGIRGLLSRLKPSRGTMGKGAIGLGIAAALGGAAWLGSGSDAEAATGEKPAVTPESQSIAKEKQRSPKILRAFMIKDKKQRETYNAMVQERLELVQGKQTEESEARIKQIDDAIDPMTQQFGQSTKQDKDFTELRLGMVKGQSEQAAQRKKSVDKKKKPKKDEAGGSWRDSGWLTGASLALDAASFIPGLNVPAGLLGAGVDALRGNYTGAGLDLLSVLPGGALLKAGKIGKSIKTLRDIPKVGKALGAARFGNDALFGMTGKTLLGAGAGALGGLGGMMGGGMTTMASLALPALGMPLMAARAMSSMFGGSSDKPSGAPADAATKEDNVEDFTKAPAGSSMEDLMQKFMDDFDQKAQMLIELMAKSNMGQDAMTGKLDKILTTR